MKKQSDKSDNHDALRAKIIGLGESSARKNYYIELQEKVKQLEHFRIMLDRANEGIFIIRLQNFKIMDINRTAEDLLQIDRDKLIDDSILKYVTIKSQNELNEFLSLKNQKNEKFFSRANLISPNKKILPISLMIHKEDYEEEKFAVLFVRDITEQIKAENKVKEANERYKFLLENVPVRIFYKNKNLLYQSCNLNYANDLGIFQEQIIGKTDFDFFPEKLAESYIYMDQLVMKKDMMIEREEPYVINNKKFIVQVKKSPVKNSKGKIIGVLGVITDITEKKETEEELKIRNEELNNFVYKVSHDLRAPLASIQGLLKLLEIDFPEFKDNKYISYINNRINKLDFFIKDVLIHSRNINTVVSFEDVNLKDIINQCVSDLSYMPGASNLKLHLEYTKEHCISDSNRLKTIFSNLISNSIKYKDPRKEFLEITIQWKIDSNNLNLVFKDNGLGIAPTVLPKVFDMFYRGNESATGSGIGLYIVQQVIKKLEGCIQLKSTPGIGTTFNIVLPCAYNNKVIPV